MTQLHIALIVSYKNAEEGCQSEEDEKNFSSQSFVVKDINDDFSISLLECAKEAMEDLVKKNS